MHRKITRIILLIFSITLVITASVTSSVVALWSIHLVRLTSFDYVDTHPTITQTNDGTIWIIWAQETFENLTLTYRTSSDLGATWSDEANLTEILGDGQNSCPAITQTSDGTIWVVWHSDRPPPPPPPLPDFSLTASPSSLSIPLNSSATSNITITSLNNFNESVDLWVFTAPANVTTAFDPPQVTPPPNDTANSTLTVTVGTTAIPGNYTLTVFARAQSALTHTIDIPLEITEATGTESYGNTSSYSEPYRPQETSEASTYDYEIYYKTSTDYGTTWSNDTQLTDNSIEDIAPSIIQLTNGTILVAWQSYRTGNQDLFYKTSSDDGATWSNATQLTTDPNSDRSPSVIQTKDGRIWVAWHSNRFGDNEILCKTYGGSWSDDFNQTTNTNEDTGPVLLQTVDETIWLFWASRVPLYAPDVYYMQSFDNGTTWTEPVQFTTDIYNDVWPAVAQTNDTKIWVVWASSRANQPYGNWDVWYKTSLAGDLDDDGVVDTNDLSRVGDAYGSLPGDSSWDAATDINNDDMVDVYDVAIVGRNYGTT
jgi:hypothetical protein